MASRQTQNLVKISKTKKHHKNIGISSENVSKRALLLHKKLAGKISISNKIAVNSSTLPLIYTPGVASVSKEIFTHPQEVYRLTSKPNNVAIVTDGTRVLGLGKIGPSAAIPVMEGKAVLYKEFGRVDAFPLCLSTTKKDEIISTIKAVEPIFGAVNLEDIESPKVFDITTQLEKIMKIPIFHDDRHGTSVIVLASLINALKLVKKKFSSVKVVIAGAGSAGYGIFQLFYMVGCRDMIVVDSKGMIYKGRKQNMNKYKKEIAARSNKNHIHILDVAFIPVTIAITSLLTFYSFTIGTHVLFPEMISVHVVLHMFRTSLHNNSDIL